MAILVTTATGNFTDAATWATVDSTALVTEAGTSRTALTTSDLGSANFIPGGITVDAIALKLSDRAAGTPTNTLTITLYDVTAATAKATVVVPVADLPECANTSGKRGGWLLFDLGGAVALTAGNNHSIRLKLDSTSTAVGFMTNGTANNWQHLLRTTTTAAPAAGDNLYTLGLWTASATWTTYTITMNNTAATVFGNAGGAASTPEERSGWRVGKSTVTWGNSASTAYLLTFTGVINIQDGGTWNQGTSGDPTTSSATHTLQFNTTTDYGIFVQGGTANFYGRTFTKNWTYLTADATSGSTTTCSVADATGWTSGSTVYVSTSRIATLGDTKEYTLAADASTSSIVLTAAVSANYDGSGIYPAHVVLQDGYNNLIQTDNAARRALLTVHQRGACNISWVKLYGNFKDVAGANVIVDSFAIHPETASGAGWELSGNDIAGTHTYTDITMVQGGSANPIVLNPSASSDPTGLSIDGFIALSTSTGGATTLDLGPYQLKNIRIFNSAGMTTAAYGASDWAAPNPQGQGCIFWGGFGVNTLHAHRFKDMKVYSASNGCINWANPSFDITFEQCYIHGPGWLIGFGTATEAQRVTFDRCVMGGLNAYGKTDTLNYLMVGSSAMTGVYDMRFLSCVFSNGYTSSGGTYIIDATGGVYNDPVDFSLSFIDCTGWTGTDLIRYTSSGTTYITPRSFISFNNHNGTDGDHRVFFPGAIGNQTGLNTLIPPHIMTSTGTYRTATPSEQMVFTTGSTGSNSFYSSPKRAAVAAGNSTTISTWANVDGSYNGTLYLMVKANPTAGIVAETVLDTHSLTTGSFEELTAVVGPVDSDCVLEFALLGNGTTGSVYVDDWSAT